VPVSVRAIAGFKQFGRVERLETLGARTAKGPFDYIHVFETEAARLEKSIAALRSALAPSGMIWVSWPKKASKVETTLTENVIRHLALTHRLVDVKVCAVDDIWSGLKLVIPKALR
jgi:hypothetical protein